tara:strand:- start:1460 stop:1702 length:243 start_codon:yes stop_codon:yes gene_type:complete
MKYVILGLLMMLNIVNPLPAMSEETPIEFKNETAQIINGEAMVFPFENAKVKKNVKDRSKKIDFFASWKNKIRKSTKVLK